MQSSQNDSFDRFDSVKAVKFNVGYVIVLELPITNLQQTIHSKKSQNKNQEKVNLNKRHL